MNRYFNILQFLTIFFFGGVIALPELNRQIRFLEEEKGHENRAKSIMPQAGLKHPDEFVKGFDKYYTDNFCLRENLIKLHNNFEFSLLSVSPVPNEVVVGKEGWFYAKNCLPNYKGNNLFTDLELTRLQNDLAARTKWAAGKGIKYYVAIVPDKMNVYPEFLPPSIIRISEQTRYDQFVSLNNDSDINIIDIRKNILKHKNKGRYLYQHTDDHWNELGSFYGYQEIMYRLSKDFTELTPFSLEDYIISNEERLGDMAQMMSVEKEYPEQFLTLTPKNKIFGHEGIKRGYAVPKGIADWDYEIVKVNDNGKKLKCLIIRDSFAFHMIKYLQEHFKETVFIHSEWKGLIPEEIILKEKPDIILNIMVETFIGNLLQFPFQATSAEQLDIRLITASNQYITVGQNDVLIAKEGSPDPGGIFSFIKLSNTECAFLSSSKKFVSADLSHLNEIIANREKMNDWEKFQIVQLQDGFAAFKAANGKYLSLGEKSHQVFASSETIGEKEKFKIIRQEK